MYQLKFPTSIGVVMLLLFMTNHVISQQTFTISGYVEDASSAEKLIGVNLFDPVSQKGTTTNTYGFYSLTLPKDSVYLSISYVGYTKRYLKLYLDKDISLNIELLAGETVEAVEIVAEKQQSIEENVQMGEVSIPIQQIKALPALLGETDVLKAIQLLPGVQSGGEGTSGFYVRGGGPDQNLILLDGVPVYNANHLFGFFSVFNADAIKNVTLTKGGFPARYGGRLSSILDINMKEGNMKSFHGEGSIGTIFSKLTLEGPIIKDKTSFIVSGRRTYIDALAGPIIRLRGAQEGFQINPRLFFNDFNAKINHKFSEKDRLFLSFYSSEDNFGLKTKRVEDDDIFRVNTGINWGNTTAAARWNKQWNKRLFSNTTLTYSKYELNNQYSFQRVAEGDSSSSGFKYSSGIEDYGLKMDYDFIPNPNHYIRFGAGVIRHTFTPGVSQFELKQGQIDIDSTNNEDVVNAYEASIYVEDTWDITPNFKANLGVHASSFTVNDKTFYSVQPRIGLRYMLPNDIGLKASFATMTQYLHLLSNEGIGLPTDLWLPTTENVIPEQSWQASLGIAKTFPFGLELSVEGYYKDMKNLISYVEGASFANNPLGDENLSWEEKITQGIGKSYGFEVFLQKKTGKTTGWLGYTWSKTDRQFDEINGGKWYPYKYDRRHDVSVVLVHEFTKNISASAVWVYGTGNSITLPISKHQPYYYEGFQHLGIDPLPENWVDRTNTLTPTISEIERPSNKNGYRMGAYHRFDVSVEFKKDKKRFLKKEVEWQRTWAVGAYNAYNRANPFFIARTGEGDNSFRQYSLFPIIPFVSYRFKF